MKRRRNIPRFHSKQTCMSMRRRPRGQTAFGEQSFIFVQDLSTSFHNIQKTPLTRSDFEKMFLHCIKSARFDARLHESPSNKYIWLLTSVTRAQPHAPSRLSGGEHGLIPEQQLDTEPSIFWEQVCDGLVSQSGRVTDSHPLNISITDLINHLAWERNQEIDSQIPNHGNYSWYCKSSHSDYYFSKKKYFQSILSFKFKLGYTL